MHIEVLVEALALGLRRRRRLARIRRLRPVEPVDRKSWPATDRVLIGIVLQASFEKQANDVITDP